MKKVIKFKKIAFYLALGDTFIALYPKSALQNSGRGVLWVVDPITAKRQPSNRHPWIVTIVEANSQHIDVYKIKCTRRPHWRRVIVGEYNVKGVLY